MKFCHEVPEICRGQVHGPRKERKRIIIIIILSTQIMSCFLLMAFIKSPKQRLETYCFCSVSYYYYYYSSFFPCTMNLSTADLRNYRTEFHETWWSCRYMFLVGPKGRLNKIPNVLRYGLLKIRSVFFHFKDHRGYMVVRFTSTCAISVYHH
jgi:hypothetical protein